MKRIILLLAIVSLASCKAHFTTAYKITTAERSYYCNHPKIVNDTVFGAELKRNGDIRNVFAIPYSQVLTLEENK